MRRVIFILALTLGACRLVREEPQTKVPFIVRDSVAQDSVARKAVQDFKEAVCPAAFNGLRVMNQEQVVDQKNFRDTTIMENLEEASTMLVIIVKACTVDPAQDTILEPKKFERTSNPHITPTLLALR